MNRKIFMLPAVLLSLGMTFTSCSNDDNVSPTPEVPTEETTALTYVLGVAADKANFLLTGNDLTQGKLSAVNNGLTSDAVTNWLTWNGERLFGLIYKQGNPATAQSYFINAENKLEKSSLQYDVKRYTSYGTYKDYLLASATFDNTEKKDAAGNIAKGVELTQLDAKTGEVSRSTFDSENFLGNGEYVTMVGYLHRGDQILSGVVPMGLSIYGASADNGKWVKYPDLVAKADGGEKSSSYKKGELQWTQYPNEAWVAIYSGLDFSKAPKLVKDTRISYPAGRFKSQYYQMIWTDDNGDTYVFSPNFSRVYFTGDVQKSTLPAGVVRIKKGQDSFDPDYYVNLEAQANGHSFIRVWPAGGSNFLLQMFEGDMGKNAEGASGLAIFNAQTKKLTMVTGLPAAGEYSFSVTPSPLYDNGKIYFPVNRTNANPCVYIIDVATAKAQAGIEVEATSLSLITKLKATK